MSPGVNHVGGCFDDLPKRASVADGDETRLASAAAFLDACGYEPGFEQAPERFARLERALDAVDGRNFLSRCRR
jgi:hypothetical protein